MIILGIDPGLAIVGWGVIEYKNSRFRTVAYGSVQTPAGMRTEERLKLIFDEQGIAMAVPQMQVQLKNGS